MNTRKQFYKMIDELPYSIKPENYKRFRRNLTDCLMDYPDDDSNLNSHEMLMQILMRRLFNEGIDVNISTISEHTIIMMALGENCSEEDDIEFEFRLPDDVDRELYSDVFDDILEEIFS